MSRAVADVTVLVSSNSLYDVYIPKSSPQISTLSELGTWLPMLASAAVRLLTAADSCEEERRRRRRRTRYEREDVPNMTEDAARDTCSVAVARCISAVAVAHQWYVQGGCMRCLLITNVHAQQKLNADTQKCCCNCTSRCTAAVMLVAYSRLHSTPFHAAVTE